MSSPASAPSSEAAVGTEVKLHRAPQLHPRRRHVGGDGSWWGPGKGGTTASEEQGLGPQPGGPLRRATHPFLLLTLSSSWLGLEVLRWLGVGSGCRPQGLMTWAAGQTRAVSISWLPAREGQSFWEILVETAFCQVGSQEGTGRSQGHSPR